MTVCAVNGCHNSSEKSKEHCNITFHLFPSDPTIAARWIEKIKLNRNDISWKPSKHTKICSLHFDETEKYTTKGGLCRLRRGAVPSKNIPIFVEEKKVQIEELVEEPQPGTSHDRTNLLTDSPAVSISSSIFDTPKKASLRSALKKKTLLQQKHGKKIKMLQQKTRRLIKKNTTLQNIVVILRKERFINKDISNILSENVFAAELFNSMAKKIKMDKKRPMPKYTPEFRKFCLTLHFYSPRAYTYVRKTFNTCLPHPKTIYNWYRNVNGSPGFTDESFKLLKSKVLCSNKKLVCALVADEMAIRPQDLKGGHGRVDTGTGTSDSVTIATEAYTLILVCLNEHWKIPLGYFLVHGISGGQKVNIIKMCLTKCAEVGVKVVALTFDAHSSNISAMQLLGCRMKDPADMNTTFKHPTEAHHVAVFLDSCHMIKLVRNHFEEKEIFLDQEENKVQWDFLEKLNELQENEGLHIGNKLTRKHLEFRNSIMKVKLASQLFSRSVAVAIKLCREDLKLDIFKGSEATEKFIMICNNLFDVFNTRKLTQHGFCHPLSNSNKAEIFDFLEETRNYILNLKIKTTRKRTFNENESSIKLKLKSFESVLTVKCSPGFKGLLVNIESLKHLFRTLIEETKELDYISTYRLSQDHIELFFGSIRMHGGHNDNPNALQFKGSYRKLLCRMEVQVGEAGNCVPLENISILTCTSALTCINATAFSQRFEDTYEDINQIIKTLNEGDVGTEIVLATKYDDPNFRNHIVGYIAGNVVRYVSTRIKCEFCIDSMMAKEKLWFHRLVCLRDKGGLIYASEEVYVICSVAETNLRRFIKEYPNYFLLEKQLTLQIMTTLIGSKLFPTSQEHLNYQHHNTNLARLIVERYLRIRFFYEAKKGNIAKVVTSKRQLFRKQLQFQGY